MVVIVIKQLYFEDFTSLACDISDKFDMVKDDFGDIAIIAKYEEAKEIIAELVCIGYSLESIEFDRPEWKNYYDEYLISLNFDGIWCQPMKVDGKYITDDSTITYILDNCSSTVISQCKGKVVFEVGMVDDEECECDCDECCGCCECDNDKELDVKSDDDGYSITVECNLDAEEAMKIIKDMENRMEHMNDMFREMDNFRRLLRW